MCSCALGTSCCRRHYWTTDGGVCCLSARHDPHPSLQLRLWALRSAVGCYQPSSCCCCCRCCRPGPEPRRWACSPPCHLAVSGAALCSLGALVHQAEEHRNILDVVGGELLEHLLIPYSLVKCNHHRSIGDTRNDIANLREPLDKGA
jgi:hypothetical protein